MATFSTFDDAWGPSTPPGPPPQKTFAGGNLPQKVLAGGNVPEKDFSQGDNPRMREEAAIIRALIAEQQRMNMRMEQLMSTVTARPSAKHALRVKDIVLIALALVFIVLVLFLISTVRRLAP